MRMTLLCLATMITVSMAQAEVPRAIIAFEEPAYVNMPVWVHITLPTLPDSPELSLAQANLRYPFQAQPWEFHGHDFRVMRDEETLTPVIDSARVGGPGSGGSVAPPTSPTGRLPLHLLYRFDRPGTYLVKYEYHGFGPRPSSKPPLAESEWTELEVYPFSPEQREAWLTEKLSHPPQDVGVLVGDHLPSVLSLPDDRVLTALLDYVHRPEELVQWMAIYSLWYCPDTTLRSAIPATIRQRGPTVPLAYLISWRREALRSAGDEIVAAALPYLNSFEPSAVAGSLKTLAYMTGTPWDLDAPTRNRAIDAAWNSVDHLKSFRDFAVLQPLLTFVVQQKRPRSRDIIWEIASRPDAPGAREQALIAVGWLGDPRDLPKLGALLLTDDPAVWPLAHQMRRAWGDRALPYLIEGLRSPNAHTRRECARELATAGRPEGFAYLLQLMKGDDQQERSSVVQFLHDRGFLSGVTTDADAVAVLEAKLRESR